MTARETPATAPRRHKGHFERGAAAVEMALVMPILILMIMGIIDFGRIFNGEIQLSQAAREGARIAALGFPAGYSLADVTTRINTSLNNPAFDSIAPTISVDVVTASGGAVSGGSGRVCVDSDSKANYGQVTITVVYKKILWGPPSGELSQKAVMKCLG